MLSLLKKVETRIFPCAAKLDNLLARHQEECDGLTCMMRDYNDKEKEKSHESSRTSPAIRLSR